jgi:hypothetical protein
MCRAGMGFGHFAAPQDLGYAETLEFLGGGVLLCDFFVVDFPHETFTAAPPVSDIH